MAVFPPAAAAGAGGGGAAAAAAACAGTGAAADARASGASGGPPVTDPARLRTERRGRGNVLLRKGGGGTGGGTGGGWGGAGVLERLRSVRVEGAELLESGERDDGEGSYRPGSLPMPLSLWMIG